MKKAIYALIALLVIAGIGAAIFVSTRPEVRELRTEAATRGDLIESASASGTVRAETQVEVKSRASGEVLEVAVAPGDHVEAGALLIRLSRVDEERLLAEARASANGALARLAQARAGLVVARTDATEAQARADVRGGAVDAGLVSREEARQSRSQAQSAEATITLRQADIQAAQAELERARLAINDAEQRLRETELRAPTSGTVLSVAAARGTIVASGITNIGGGTTLMTLADLSKLYVTVDLDEAQIGRVVVGQEAEIRVDAFPDRVFRGRVEGIAPLGVVQSNIVTFDVEVVAVDENASLLRPGMSADVEIIVSKHENVVLVPVAALRSEGREHFVLLAPRGEGAEPERRVVRSGATDGIHVIIEEGIAEGESVVIAGMEEEEPERRSIFGSKRR